MRCQECGEEILELENGWVAVHVCNSYEEQRPPIGVKPEIFHKEQRLRDLARAINDYIQDGFFGGDYATTVGIWCDELSRRLKEFK